ncbi:MAG TPA: sodium:solute symporter family protein [Thermoanaerobaculia bacterium]|nr:sodium:solute symporter family protein [Thermoanaerobaculia bacterium]
MTLALVGVYLAALVAIGALSGRFARGTGEDFFLASRTIGPVVLLASLVGTHMTAFSILGASGESYHRGIGVFGLMASSSALVVPALFLFIGTRLWALGKRHGFLTQVELVRARWGSEPLAISLLVLLVVLLVPYLLIGIKGAGLTLNEASGGSIPVAAGSFLVGAVVVAYVAWGGMRGTAWVNTFQTAIFVTLGAVAFWVVVRGGGGLSALMAKVAAEEPKLLVQGDAIRPLEMLTYLTIPISAATFPHLVTHWLTAKSARAFRFSVVAYPFCVALVWLPSVVLGVIGKVEVPGLAGPASSSVVVRLIERFAPAGLEALLTAGLFAAVMASLDSQVLALGNLFTRDVVGRYGFGGRLSERGQVLSGRLFVAGIVVVACLVSLVFERSLFKLGVICFSGFTGLFPLLVAALFWRRATAAGALASVLVTAVSWAFFALRSFQNPAYTVGDTGILPAAVILLLSSLALWAVSLLTRPPGEERLAGFFGRGAEA